MTLRFSMTLHICTKTVSVGLIHFKLKVIVRVLALLYELTEY